MNKKQKKMLFRILLSAALLIALHFTPFTGAVRFLAYMVPYVIIGYDILRKAGLGIKNRQVFDECFLMAVATVGAIAIGLVIAAVVAIAAILVLKARSGKEQAKAE